MLERLSDEEIKKVYNIQKAMELHESHRSKEDWWLKDGFSLRPCRMTDSHLQNSILFLKKKEKLNIYEQKMLAIFENEVMYRKIIISFEPLIESSKKAESLREEEETFREVMGL